MHFSKDKSNIAVCNLLCFKARNRRYQYQPTKQMFFLTRSSSELFTQIPLYCILLIIMLQAPVCRAEAADGTYQAGIEQRGNFFSRVYDAQYQSSFHIGTNRPSGSYMLRIHRGFRFDQHAYQWELESYPVLSDRFYAYAAYAYSDSEIFPLHRAGLELFSALPWRLEGSLGLRYLDFEPGTETVMITPSLSHYFSAFMITVRPFFIFSDGGSGQTWLGSFRWFFNDSGDYLLIRGAVGRSSDEMLFQVGQARVKDFLLLKSSQIGVEGRYYVTERISGLAGLTLYRQELSFDPGNYVSNWSVRAGFNLHW